MTAAVFGIVGVLVGGAIAVISQYMLLRRQELRAARAAARLLRTEFGEAMGFLTRSQKAGKWEMRPSHRLTLTVWEHQSASLAAVADRTLWEVVSLAAANLADLVRATAEVLEGDPLDRVPAFAPPSTRPWNG